MNRNASKEWFTPGHRPVIRWVKGDGQDDDITRAALAHATAIFGNSVDYCLTVNGLPAERARRVLAWASRPVELWFQEPSDSPGLARALEDAECRPEAFGYWWKWFPERVRPAGPEWILDGDMVILQPPRWVAAWMKGTDGVRLTQFKEEQKYGIYEDLVDARRFYSGLLSLPPHHRYMRSMLEVLAWRPLRKPHDGRRDVDEQGCVAAAFSGRAVHPIPIAEFPFAQAGHKGIHPPRTGKVRRWGCHFSCSFRTENEQFLGMVRSGLITDRPSQEGILGRWAWLRNRGQWGPGHSPTSGKMQRLLDLAARYAGKPVLVVGTARGYVPAVLADIGCRVTTVDAHDQGAEANLEGMDIEIVRADPLRFVEALPRSFPLVVADLGSGDVAERARLHALLKERLMPGGCLVVRELPDGEEGGAAPDAENGWISWPSRETASPTPVAASSTEGSSPPAGPRPVWQVRNVMKVPNPFAAARCRSARIPAPCDSYVTESYSQGQEDLVALGLLEALCQRTGLAPEELRYLEIGAHHPFAISSTYLIQVALGARGCLVEADPALVPGLIAHRPRDVVLGIAIGERDEAEAPFLRSPIPALSGLDAGIVDAFHRRLGVDATTTLRVASRSLDSFLEKEYPFSRLDFLAIPLAGGAGLALLRGSRLSIRPALIQLETVDATGWTRTVQREALRWMDSMDYTLAAQVDWNLLFADRRTF